METDLPRDLTALARLYVALPCWEWRRGMALAGDSITEIPDLTDPATLGAILGLLRERSGDPRAFAAHDMSRQRRGEPPVSWWFVEVDYTIVGDGPTEPHALYAALAALETTT